MKDEMNISNVSFSIPETAQGTLENQTFRETKTVKLPKLIISKYYGDPAFWLEFYNQFESAIHNNSNLSKIDKFNYLRSYLGGTASTCISGFALTEENYDAALDILKGRFGNKNTLIQTHLNELLKIPIIKSINDLDGLRRLFDKADTQIRSLESLGVETKIFQHFIDSHFVRKNSKGTCFRIQ
ncbi:uncharacterized protein LOC118186998 [Stegodyphus dumicola]|uniref:uncharacterized protein LOC118186998 n=1 Tax=Stegodyphus dumicola TaxID=202533 RepID=UPI0015A956F9|nr:uncharacterized protein LOC118186998 [Stegodyphus dumicola]